jgi:hypothetical protein
VTSDGLALAGTLCCVIAVNPCNLLPVRAGFGWYLVLLVVVGGACACVFPSECSGWYCTIDYEIVCCLRCVVLLPMLVFSLVVAVSTFDQRTVCRYNNTHCTYGVNLQHEGSISELHFFAKNNR